MYDYMRVQGSILANSLDPFYTPSALLNAKTTSLGLQYELGLANLALVTENSTSIKNSAFSIFISAPIKFKKGKK